MIEPRPYQVDAITAVNAARTRGVTRQLISLPTGCGKTIVFSLLAKEHNVKTLVIAHSEELINQAKEKFRVVWPDADIGIVKAENNNTLAHVVIASVQTAHREKRLQKLKEQNFGLMIIDECHHSAANSYTKVVQELGFLSDDPNKLLVGVTATPKRGDDLSLGSIFQEIVFDASIGTMIRSGYLSPIVGKQIITAIELDGIAVLGDDFVSSQLTKVVNTPQRNKLIVEQFLEHAKDRKKVLAFCSDVQHAKDLSECFRAKDIQSQSIYGALEADERKQVLKDFSSGKIQVLTNCMVLTEGFDQPDVDCIILARPTKSGTLYTQMIGRGTRLHPTKSNCLVLDFVDNCKKHTLCNFKNTLDGLVLPLLDQEEKKEAEVDQVSDEEAIAFSRSSYAGRMLADRVENIEFFDKVAFAWTPVGDAWHLRLTNDRDIWVRKSGEGYNIVANDKGQIITLSERSLPLDYALGISEDWARKQTTKNAWARKDAAWRQGPPTQKQLETLTKLGFTLDYGVTKGEASQLIDSKMSEKALVPATSKQIWWLKSRGVAVQNGLTKMQAQKLIAAQKNQSDCVPF